MTLSADRAAVVGLAPHSPETALLQGTAGWFPAGSEHRRGADPGEPRELSTDARSFNGCTECHATEQVALSLLTVAGNRIKDDAEVLIDLLKQVDPGLEAPGGEIDARDPTFTVAEGAFFNYNLSIFPEEGELASIELLDVAGATTHNPFLMEALLVASIDAVETEYAVVASVRRDWGKILADLLQRADAHARP